MKKIITYVIDKNIIPIILLFLLCVYILGAFTTLKGEVKWLISANEYKKELIEAYEVYYDASECIIEEDYLNMDSYYRAKERLDSLYTTQE